MAGLLMDTRVITILPVTITGMAGGDRRFIAPHTAFRIRIITDIIRHGTDRFIFAVMFTPDLLRRHVRQQIFTAIKDDPALRHRDRQLRQDRQQQREKL